MNLKVSLVSILFKRTSSRTAKFFPFCDPILISNFMIIIQNAFCLGNQFLSLSLFTAQNRVKSKLTDSSFSSSSPLQKRFLTGRYILYQMYLSTCSTAFCIRAYFDFVTHFRCCFCCLDFYFARAHFKSKRLGRSIVRVVTCINTAWIQVKEDDHRFCRCNLAATFCSRCESNVVDYILHFVFVFFSILNKKELVVLRETRQPLLKSYSATNTAIEQ